MVYCGVTVVCLILASFAFNIDSKEVCTTPACQRVADYLLRTTDYEEDPCVDYRKYSCGVNLSSHEEDVTQKKWTQKIERALIKELENESDNGEEWVNNARTYYKACLATKIPDLAPFFREQLALFEKMPLEDLLANLLKNYTTPVIIQLYKFGIDKPLYGLRDAGSVFISPEFFHRRTLKDLKAYYQSYKETTMYSFEWATELYGIKLKSTVEELIMLEEKLYLFSEPAEYSDYQETEAAVSLSEIVKQFGHHRFNITRYFGNLIDTLDHKDTVVDNNMYTINAMRILSKMYMNGHGLAETGYEYWEQIMSQCQKRYEQTIRDYAFYKFLHTIHNHIIVHLRRSEAGDNARKGLCALMVGDRFWPLRLRAQRKLTPKYLRDAFKKVVDVTVPMFIKMVNESKKLPKVEKEMMMGKLEHFKVYEDFPEELVPVGNKLSQEVYGVFSNFSKTDYFTNSMRYLNIRGREEIEGKRQTLFTLTTPHTLCYYGFTAFQLSSQWALKTFLSNEEHVNIPYVNYARMSFIMGHELAHILDRGSWFFYHNHTIRPYHTWSRDFVVHMEKVQKCQADEFRRIPHDYQEMSSMDNTEVSVHERFADAFGVKIGLQAFRELVKDLPLLPSNYFNESSDPVFFASIATSLQMCYVADEHPNPAEDGMDLGFANRMMNAEHPLGWQRIRVVARHSEEFSNAYKCPKRNVCEFFL